jgi:arginine:ornithine antiporter/lysine permease
VAEQRTASEQQGGATLQKVSVLALTGMVVGSMVGGGVFSLPQSFGSATGVLGALIAWTIAGFGMLMLALVFQSLAVRRPDLDSGIYIYAQTDGGRVHRCRVDRERRHRRPSGDVAATTR